MKRNNMVQVFRAIAIIAVVMIHTSPAGYWQVFFKPFINFPVATFLFLSGYLTRIDNENWSAFFKKRISRVIIPYIIWTLLYTLFTGNLHRLPANLLTAQTIAPFYYIFVYIQFVLLTPLMGKLGRSRYRWLGWLVTPLSMLVFQYPMLAGTRLPYIAQLFWDDSCLGWFTFYYLGLLLGNRIIDNHSSKSTLGLLLIASIALQMAEGYAWMKLGQPVACGTQMKLSTVLTNTVLMLIVHQCLQSRSHERQRPILVALGDYSFGIFLCHIMVLKTLRLIPYYQAIPYPVTSLIVLLISFAVCYCVTKIGGNHVSKWLGLK